ncbi:MAG: class I SAM-dependent methyltransferase [Planctomycetota bacterium]
MGRAGRCSRPTWPRSTSSTSGGGRPACTSCPSWGSGPTCGSSTSAPGSAGRRATSPESSGAEVTGIDLTPEHCEVATMLAAELGLGDRARFIEASATDLPFEAERFDAAYMMHVGMNVADKAAMYREIHRVLRPGAVFGIYDIMVGAAGGPLAFPVPWATVAETSFLVDADEACALCAEAGFVVEDREDRTEASLAFFYRLAAQAADGPVGLPPLGLHLLMGPDFEVKVRNMVANIQQGRCGPWELVCRKPA